MMNKLKEKMITMKMRTICKANELAEIKEDGDKALIIELVLIAVAVGLAVIFRNQITTLVTDFVTRVTTAINGLF